MRVHEWAKANGLASGVVVDAIEQLGIDAKGHRMAMLDAKAIAVLEAHFGPAISGRDSRQDHPSEIASAREETRSMEPTSTDDASQTTWMVELPHFSPQTIEAVDRGEAIERYKQLNGIINSEHEFSAEAAGE
jgi:hypothetical protein